MYEHDLRTEEGIICVNCGSDHTDYSSDNGGWDEPDGDDMMHVHDCGLKCRDCGARWEARVIDNHHDGEEDENED